MIQARGPKVQSDREIEMISATSGVASRGKGAIVPSRPPSSSFDGLVRSPQSPHHGIYVVSSKLFLCRSHFCAYSVDQVTTKEQPEPISASTRRSGTPLTAIR
jgi:hypothetical protein